MEGYKLTAKGYLTFTLLFFTFFSGLTSILSSWIGIRLPFLLPALPPVTSSPVTPSPAPPAGIVVPPPSVGGLPQPPDTGSPPTNDPGGPPADGDQPGNRTPDPPAPLPGNGLQLLFPFAGRDLSEQNKADLHGFLSQMPGAQNGEPVLVIEGRAHAGEAPADTAVKALADERMRLVRDYCLAQGVTFDLLPVSAVKDSASSAAVVGASLYYIRRTDK